MFRSLFFIFIIFCLSACVSSPVITPTNTAVEFPQITIPSEWAGAITHADGTRESIIVKFTATGGTLNIQPQARALKTSEFQQTGASMSFKAGDKDEMLFSGNYDGLHITGQVTQNGTSASFILLPLLSESTDSLNAFIGTYQFDSGEALLINLAPEYTSSDLYFFGQGLMVTHFGTGAIRGLYPVAGDTYLVGSARAIGYPFTEQITFQRDVDGNVNSLLWQTRDPATGEPGEALQARRLALTSETVHFTSEDGTNLTGLLTLPETPAPYPAIMLLHGSEPGTRDNFGSQQMSAFMASQGIVILTYDKRGVGDSEGRYVEAPSEINVERTAQDAIAGVEYLKSRPEISAEKIGLTGFSQAGWVIPLAASRSADIAYIIVLSGPVTSVRHEDIYSTYTNDGDTETNYSEAEIAQKLAVAPHSGFNSTPVIANLNQPGIWIWGDQDKSLPVFESRDNLKGIIAQGKSNFTYLILQNADHNLHETTQGLFNEMPFSSGFHPDYYKTMAQWLAEHVK